MRPRVLWILSCAAAILSAQTAIAGERQQSFQAQKGELLQVNVGGGNVTIRGWEKNEVLVKVRSVNDEQLKNVEMSQGGGKVLIEYRWNERRQERIDFDISVPTAFSVDCRTGGGNVELLAPLSGTVRAGTAGGNVTIGDLGGKISLETAGGNIRAGQINGDLEARSAGGEIKLAGAVGEVNVSTAGGDLTIGNTGKRMRASTAGGNISIGKISGDIDASTAGGNIRAESGQGTIALRTAGGNVELRSARGKVMAESSAGNVTLEEIQGSIMARTSAGNIDATLDPSVKESSTLSTSAGDITLRISDKARATIVARSRSLRVMGEEDDRGAIESDFPFVREPGSGDRIEATIVLNGGGHRIQVETLIGTIRIKKAR